MIEIDRIRIGTILITEEFAADGQWRLVYGLVVLIDRERQVVGIKTGEDIRSFRADQLWTIPAFIFRKRGERFADEPAK